MGDRLARERGPGPPLAVPPIHPDRRNADSGGRIHIVVTTLGDVENQQF